MLLLLFSGGHVVGQATARYLIVARPLRYVLLAQGPSQGAGMPFLGQLPVVAPDQAQTIALDFGRFLPSGITLTGTPTLNVSVKYGSDPSPASRIDAGPTIGTASIAIGGSGIANTAILFQVTGCLPGVTYIIEAVCSRSDGDTAEGYAYLPCVAPQ